MNVFVLPSWYPSSAQPMAGLFVHDQARGVASVRPTWNLVVGTWGHHDGALALRDATASVRALRWRLRTRPGWRDEESGALNEVLTPRLSWTLAIARGGAGGLLRASLANLRAAESRFGRMALLHAHVAFPAGWIAARIAARTGQRYVLTEHMSPFPFRALRNARGQPNAAVRDAFAGASATVAVSRSLATAIRAAGLPCSDVLPNVVDDSRFPLRAPPPGGDFRFFALSSLVPRKGVDVLLRAMALMRHTAVSLRIGGDGPERAALQALAGSLGLGQRVHFLGALRPDDVPAQHAASNAFVLASFEETFGVVLVEALMSGRPVIATRCGGPETSFTPATAGSYRPVTPWPWPLPSTKPSIGGSEHDAAALRADAIARFSSSAVGESLAALYERVVA
jgi:glycosyltransferase involved in cell wall biosynthesis